MTKKSKKEVKRAKEIKVLSRDEIMSHCKAKPSQVVEVEGWQGGVRMKNIDFAKFSQIVIDAGNDSDARCAMIVAAACEDLDLTDAYALQKGNGLMFAPLYAAVNKFLGYDFDAEGQKN